MLWVGQFGIANGEAKEDTPWVGAYTDPGRGEERSDIYILVHPATPGSEEFCGEMKDAIGAAFHKEKASLTGGVFRALQSAHENLREWNRRSMKEHHVAAGITCFATGEEHAYLAQVAPAAAVFHSRGDSQLIEPRLPDASEPLGLFDDFHPEFTAFDLAEGDRLLLLSPDLAAAVPMAELTAVLMLPEEDALPELYRKAQGIENCAALLISRQPDPVTA